MNKKLGRLLQPAMGGYLVIMMAFALAAALFQNYILAILEILITALVFVLYQVNRTKRRKKLQDFVQNHLDETFGSEGAKPPFPILVLRLADGGVVYANDAFIHMTDILDSMAERNVTEILPGFEVGWLTSGQTE